MPAVRVNPKGRCTRDVGGEREIAGGRACVALTAGPRTNFLPYLCRRLPPPPPPLRLPPPPPLAISLHESFVHVNQERLATLIYPCRTSNHDFPPLPLHPPPSIILSLAMGASSSKASSNPQVASASAPVVPSVRPKRHQSGPVPPRRRQDPVDDDDAVQAWYNASSRVQRSHSTKHQPTYASTSAGGKELGHRAYASEDGQYYFDPGESSPLSSMPPPCVVLR